MKIINPSKFEEIMKSQENMIIVLTHCGSFKHNTIFSKFNFQSNELEYSFNNLGNNIDDGFITNSIYKNDITYFKFLDFSNQVELGLKDGNKALLDLCN